MAARHPSPERTDAPPDIDPDHCDHPPDARFGLLALYRGDATFDDHIKCEKCGGNITCL